MRLEPLSVLQTLRDLWSKPRDMARFHEYVGKIREGLDGEYLTPLVTANPMAKPAMIEYVDKLVALDADGIVAKACGEAEGRLAASALAARVSLVPVDDVGGTWSERTSNDFTNRFGKDRMIARDQDKPTRYVVAQVFSSETPTADMLRTRVLASIYRAAHAARHGPPATVGLMVAQEGRALRFAGVPPTPGADVAAARAAIAPLLDARDDPRRFVAMYGDAAGRRHGYPALGVPPHAGFLVALDDAMREAELPEAWV